MTEEEIKLLLARYAGNQCTPDEKKLVEAWLRKEEMQSNWSWNDDAHFHKVKQRITRKIEQNVPLNLSKHSRFNYGLVGVAASLLLLLSVIMLWRGINQEQASSEQVIALPEQIGGAKLTMSDGTVIELAELKAGAISRKGGASLKKAAGNSLIYTYQDGMKAEPVEEQFNILRVPAGTTYQLSLPDGSKVWLNACSELSFPVVFGKKNRKVVLKGEAYFEVAPEVKHPFMVDANGSSIVVMGTAFNVSAYPEQQLIQTTLTAGAVAVNMHDQYSVLKPGEQATIDLENLRMVKAKVDTEIFLAWKSGYFVFDDLDIKAIMHQISRWYNVEVVFKGDIPLKRFGGTFSRSKPIEELLVYLEHLGNMRFKLEDGAYLKKERRIVVMP